MITHEQISDVIGSTAYDSDGDKIGKIGNVYYDDATEQPKWLTVSTGLFGTNETFIPVQGSDLAGDGRVTTTYDKATVKDAPNVSADGHLSPEEEQQLYRYYNLSDDTATDRVDTGAGTGIGGQDATANRDRRDLAGESEVVGRDTSGPTTDKAMTRSEEQLRVGTETREAGTARLRKHVVTENVSTTVPVSHDEVTLHREPITEANRGDAMAGGDLTEEEHEVTLREERAVVDKDVVPVERVRLGTETHTEQQQVDETVRKEVIDTDGVEGRRGVEGERESTDRTGRAGTDREVTDRTVAEGEVADRDRAGR